MIGSVRYVDEALPGSSMVRWKAGLKIYVELLRSTGFVTVVLTLNCARSNTPEGGGWNSLKPQDGGDRVLARDLVGRQAMDLPAVQHRLHGRQVD